MQLFLNCDAKVSTFSFRRPCFRTQNDKKGRFR